MGLEEIQSGANHTAKIRFLPVGNDLEGRIGNLIVPFLFSGWALITVRHIREIVGGFVKTRYNCRRELR